MMDEVGEGRRGGTLQFNDYRQHLICVDETWLGNPQPLERKSERGSCLHQEFANDRFWDMK